VQVAARRFASGTFVRYSRGNLIRLLAAAEKRESKQQADSQSTSSDDELRTQLLQKALLHVSAFVRGSLDPTWTFLFQVPTCGWTTSALQAAVAEAGLSAASIGMFPRGAYDLVVRSPFNESQFVWNARLNRFVNTASQDHVIASHNRELSKRMQAMPLHMCAPFSFVPVKSCV
jgi:hypothetical protein